MDVYAEGKAKPRMMFNPGTLVDGIWSKLIEESCNIDNAFEPEVMVCIAPRNRMEQHVLNGLCSRGAISDPGLRGFYAF